MSDLYIRKVHHLYIDLYLQHRDAHELTTANQVVTVRFNRARPWARSMETSPLSGTRPPASRGPETAAMSAGALDIARIGPDQPQ